MRKKDTSKNPFDDDYQEKGKPGTNPFDDNDENIDRSKQTNNSKSTGKNLVDQQQDPARDVQYSTISAGHTKKVRIEGVPQDRAEDILRQQKENPDDVIFYNDFQKYRLGDGYGSSFKKVLLSILLVLPVVLQLIICNLFEDLMLSQFLYQVALVVCLRLFETYLKVDYDIIMMKDLQFVKRQIKTGICFICLGILLPCLFAYICKHGFYQLPPNFLEIPIPLLDVGDYDRLETFLQIVYIILLGISSVFIMPLVEQRYIYQLIQGQLGTDITIIQYVCAFCHLSAHLVGIYKAFFHGKLTLVLIVALVYQLGLCIWIASTFNINGYIQSVMLQSASNLMLLLFIVFIYFTDWLNYDYDMSFFIEGKNTIDCIIYSFNKNPLLRC